MRCLTSPYILFSFWAKTKTAEGLAKSLCDPLRFPSLPKAKKGPGNKVPQTPKTFFTLTFFQKNLKKAQFPSILSPAVS